jgi:hypothetical protein
VKTRQKKMVEITYHKGAHGVSSSRKGYGHLEKAQGKLQLLSPKYKIIENHFSLLTMPQRSTH